MWKIPDHEKNHEHSTRKNFTMNEEYKTKQITELSTSCSGVDAID